MQKEYASRADTTANKLELLQNSLNKISVEMGDALLPTISDGLQQAMPLLTEVADFIKGNPEVIKVAAGAGAGLAAMGGIAVIGALIAAVGPIGLLLGALVGAATFIATNWSTIKDAWEHGKPMAPKPLTHNQQVVSDAYNFNKPLPTTGFGYLDVQQEVGNKYRGNDFLHDIRVITGQQAPTPLLRGDGPTFNYSAPTGQDIISGGRTLLAGEMVVRFENAPLGLRVSEGKTNAPNVRMVPDVAYNQFSSQYLLRK
jgi:hypothetical protein